MDIKNLQSTFSRYLKKPKIFQKNRRQSKDQGSESPDSPSRSLSPAAGGREDPCLEGSLPPKNLANGNDSLTHVSEDLATDSKSVLKSTADHRNSTVSDLEATKLETKSKINQTSDETGVKSKLGEHSKKSELCNGSVKDRKISIGNNVGSDCKEKDITVTSIEKNSGPTKLNTENKDVKINFHCEEGTTKPNKKLNSVASENIKSSDTQIVIDSQVHKTSTSGSQSVFCSIGEEKCASFSESRENSTEETETKSFDQFLSESPVSYTLTPQKSYLRKAISSSCSPPRHHLDTTIEDGISSSDQRIAARRHRSRADTISTSQAVTSRDLDPDGGMGSRHSSCASEYRERWARGRRKGSKGAEGLIRISRDPTQPARGSISDINSQTSLENIENKKEDEDLDFFPDLNLTPMTRPRAFTCPTTRSFNRRAKAKVMNRPPTPTTSDLPSDHPSVLRLPSASSMVEPPVAEQEAEGDE